MWSKAFWIAALERAIRTLCQAAVAAIVAAGTGLVDTDWAGIGSVAGMAAVVSLLMSVGSDIATGGGGPGLTEDIGKPDKGARPGRLSVTTRRHHTHQISSL